MNEEATGPNGPYTIQHEWADAPRTYPMVAAEEARHLATDFEHKLRTVVHERPVVSVLTAAGIGYFIARLFARGMR
jgi:hypothetical protein